MRIRRMWQVFLLLLAFATAPQNVLAAPGQNLKDNTSIQAIEFADVTGIWRLHMQGINVTMALNQSGDSIFGNCKFEGARPSNGLVAGFAGSLSGNTLIIAMDAMRDGIPGSSQMMGVISGDTMWGRYISYDGNGNLAKDTFTATRLSSNTSGYTPAKITELPPFTAAEQPQTDQKTSITTKQETSTTIEQPYQTNESTVMDVKQLAKGLNPLIKPIHALL